MTPPPTPRAYVRLTDAAIEDLRALNRLDPQIVRWAFKKMLLLERDPMAGEPLLGGLTGYRKLVVGDRDWRIVWRVTQDDQGHAVLDIAEVWAVGARSDSQVYAEMRVRLDAAAGQPGTATLEEAVAELARSAWGLEASAEPTHQPLPGWLVRKLTTVAGLSAEQVDGMSLEQAFDAWPNGPAGPADEPVPRRRRRPPRGANHSSSRCAPSPAAPRRAERLPGSGNQSDDSTDRRDGRGEDEVHQELPGHRRHAGSSGLIRLGGRRSGPRGELSVRRTRSSSRRTSPGCHRLG